MKVFKTILVFWLFSSSTSLHAAMGDRTGILDYFQMESSVRKIKRGQARKIKRGQARNIS